MRTIARHLMRATASAALVASLAPQASAQTEPTLTVSPSLSSVVLSGSVTVTVLACAYESGDNMINLDSIRIRTWHYATAAGYVDVTGNFTMENADPAECNFFGNQSDEVFVKWVGTVTATPVTGPVIVNAHIYSLGENFYQSIKTYFPPAARRSVAVVSEQGFVEALPSASRSERFTVTNTGNDTATFALTASGCSSGAISASCTIAPSSTISALAAGASSTVTVSYTASGSNGATGLLRLLAVRSAETTIRDSAWTDITVTAAPSVGAHLFGHAPGAGDYLLRNAGVTIALTPQAASECGDLRIVHALVSVRTMGRTRAPVLLYNSAHARPIPLVQADIRLRSDIGLPTDGTTSIVRTDTSATCGSRSTAGTAWGAAGNVRRVVVPFSDCPVATGMYRYRVQFTSSNQSHTSADTGRLYIVNHSASRFGAGWWLAGLERLRIRSSTELLWIGGDGSVRRYVKSGSVWKVPTAFALPDSITQSGSTYIRYTAEHARVFYDSAGRHDSTRTIDRHVTRFVYAGTTDSLLAMHVPLADTATALATSMKYTFAYINDSTVTITAPGNRVTTLRRPGGRLTRIIDPDGDTTRFEYASSPYANEINAINDRAGARTSFAYDSARRVITATRPLGNVLAIEPSESKGWTPTALDSVFTQVDGPRSDVADKSRMWVNRYGSAVRLRDALGRETKVNYSATWAGLPERTVSPTRLTTVAGYNGRGLVDSVLVATPFAGASGSASGSSLTKYEWHASLYRIERTRARSGTGTDSTKFDTLTVASYNSDSTLA